MNGPFRTPATMPRAPIPPYGHREWHPRPELLGALDPADATLLVSMLASARTERFGARVDVVGFLTWSVFFVAGLARLDGSATSVAWIVACVGFAVLNARRSRQGFARAEQLRSDAYYAAERALEAKLARDERPAALRAITNLDVIERALLGGISGGAA